MPDSLALWSRSTVDGFTVYRRPATASAGEKDAVPGHSPDPVLFLNGCALAAAGWLPVIEQMPDRDVIAIDRPGFADTPWPGTLPDLAGELAAMERAIAGHPRVVIVAHSMASFRAEAFARLHPGRVAGIVLVDPSIEDYRFRGPAGRFSLATWLPIIGALVSREEIGEFVSWLSHQGFLRQTGSGRVLDPEAFKDPYTDPDTLKASIAEWLSYRSQAADLQSLRRRTDPVRARTSALLAPPLPGTRRSAILTDSFADLVRHEIRDSRHLMMIDRPDMIVEAVDEVSAGR